MAQSGRLSWSAYRAAATKKFTLHRSPFYTLKNADHADHADQHGCKYLTVSNLRKGQVNTSADQLVGFLRPNPISKDSLVDLVGIYSAYKALREIHHTSALPVLVLTRAVVTRR